MPAAAIQYRERLIIATLVLDIIRHTSKTYLDNERAGTSCSDMLLVMAVYIGQHERRPLKAAKLATLAGLPRPTVIRRLRVLAEGGLVVIGEDGRCTLPVSKLKAQEYADVIAPIVRMIHRAARQLSNLDR